MMSGSCAGDVGTEPGLFAGGPARTPGCVPRRPGERHRTPRTLLDRATTTGFCVMFGRPMRVWAGSVPSHKLLNIWHEFPTCGHVFLNWPALYRTLSFLLRCGTEPIASGRDGEKPHRSQSTSLADARWAGFCTKCRWRVVQNPLVLTWGCRDVGVLCQIQDARASIGRFCTAS